MKSNYKFNIKRFTEFMLQEKEFNFCEWWDMLPNKHKGDVVHKISDFCNVSPATVRMWRTRRYIPNEKKKSFAKAIGFNEKLFLTKKTRNVHK